MVAIQHTSLFEEHPIYDDDDDDDDDDVGL